MIVLKLKDGWYIHVRVIRSEKEGTEGVECLPLEDQLLNLVELLLERAIELLDLEEVVKVQVLPDLGKQIFH